MSLYYVYTRRDGVTDGSYSPGRLLTCESRYVADELFRACQDFTDSYGKPCFTKLERSSPQFWIYETANYSNALEQIVYKGPLPASAVGRIFLAVLPKSASPNYWPLAPTVPGRDWVSGNTYFIRNIRQPSLYWFDRGGQLAVSEHPCQKTKFRVVGTDLGGAKRVIVRSDFIRLEIPQTNNNPTKHVEYDSNKSLTCTSTGGALRFRFGDLLGRFGTRCLIGDLYGPEVRGTVTWGEGDDQDEWELC